MGHERDNTYYDEIYRSSPRYRGPYSQSPDLKNWAIVLGWLLEDPESQVLDIGCGTGQFAAYIFDHGYDEYYGVDFSDEAIRVAKDRVPTMAHRFIHGDVGTLPLAQFHDHTVCLLEVLEHLGDDLGFLRGVPHGTKVIASVPSFDDPAHVRVFPTEASIRERYGDLVDISQVVQSDRGTFLFRGMRRAAQPDRPFKGKILGIVLSNSRENEIEDAIKSLDCAVDGFLILDTGIRDKTIERAMKAAGADRVWVHKWPWRNNFSEARNEGLRVATGMGATWGIFLDTDMRYVGSEQIRSVLTADAPPVQYITSRFGCIQPLVFRLPTTLKWSGRAHNALSHPGERRVVRGVETWELIKSKEASRERFLTHLQALTLSVAEDPKNPRGWYYLGDTYSGLGFNDSALEAFRRCADLRGWNEESAWACFKAAVILVDMKRYEEAVDEAARGLARHAGIAELAWVAGLASWRSKRYDQAVYWARLALVWTERVNEVKRIGFRDNKVLRSGAWDILRFALRALGDTEGAAEAEARYRAAEST